MLYSTEVTNTSPLSINATSFPLGESTAAVAPDVWDIFLCVGGIAVTNYLDIYFLWVVSRVQCVYFAVLAECHSTVPCYRKASYGMCVEIGQLAFGASIDVPFVDVESAIFF